MTQTWCNVQIQERDLHVGAIEMQQNYYGDCELCGSCSDGFQLWRTSIDTKNQYKHNVCSDCAQTAAETFKVPIDRMINCMPYTGMKIKDV